MKNKSNKMLIMINVPGVVSLRAELNSASFTRSKLFADLALAILAECHCSDDKRPI
jgi:hypothetical protein